MDKNFLELLTKFMKIKKQGYINSNSKYKNKSGLLFEKLLNSTGGDFYIPDFKDIEIKVTSYYKEANIHLFNHSPDGKFICASKWLTHNYGYPDQKFKYQKVLKGDINATKYNKIGLNNYFKLKIDNLNKKIILNIYDINLKLINWDIYWDFDELQKIINLKLKKLAIINVEYAYSNNTYYCYFKEIHLYKLKSFNHFVNELNKGNIIIKFNTGIHKSGKNIGKFHDHGTNFKIKINNIEDLFYKIY